MIRFFEDLTVALGWLDCTGGWLYHEADGRVRWTDDEDIIAGWIAHLLGDDIDLAHSMSAVAWVWGEASR